MCSWIESSLLSKTPFWADDESPIDSVTARFDNLAGGDYQRIFDFGNGALQDNALLTCDTTRVKCGIYQNGINKILGVYGVVVEGELATWRFGVDADNRMWLEKNGVLLGEFLDGQIPANVTWASTLLGSSNWSGNTLLVGLISGFQVKQFGYPGQNFSSSFTASAYVRFDDYAGGWYQRGGNQTDAVEVGDAPSCSRLFDFGNGEGNNDIWFGTRKNTNDLHFEIHNQGSAPQTLIAPGALSPAKCYATTSVSTPGEHCSLTRTVLHWYRKQVSSQPVFFHRKRCLGEATVVAVSCVG